MRVFNISIVFSLIIFQLAGFTQEISSFDPEDYKTGAASEHYNYVELKFHSGSHPNSSKYIQELLAAGYKALEFRVGTQSTGRQIWQRAHNYPQYGVGFFLGNLGNTTVDSTLGTPSGLFGYIGIPWIRTKKFHFNTDLSAGLSYDFEPYDAETNPYNDVIGSWMNVYFNLNFVGYYEISDRMDLSLGWSLTHFSNGRWRTPNKGVNLMGFNLGVAYHFNPITRFKQYSNPNASSLIRPEFNTDPLPPLKKYTEIYLMGSIGTSTIQGPTGNEAGNRYFNSSWSADYTHKFWRRGKYMTGFDFFYDGSLAEGYDKPASDVTFLERSSYGWHIGHGFFIERITFITQLGFYIYKESEERGSWYMRAGGDIDLNENWSAHICLKTMNGGIADWVEWGIARKIRIRDK
ncbi:MAG: acyloxyacyl hydrolase [Bacteroidales bacterium]|nr:acyloxyacyl hydrolase [Bacteroidales bacterium]